MSMSREDLDKIRKTWSQLNLKKGSEQEHDAAWLLDQIPKLLSEAEAQRQNLSVHRIANSNGVKILRALTNEAAAVMVAMCTTYGTVTWSLMQDSQRTLEPGGGLFFRSEELPEELRPAKTKEPHALPKTEPDSLSDIVFTIEGS